MNTIAIIDYGAGNLRSVAKAFERSSRDYGILVNIKVTSDIGIIAKADRIVFPGVGAFPDCRSWVDRVHGLYDVLERRVIHDSIPFLGICVGMQLMAKVGFEHMTTKGFSWIDGEVHRIIPKDKEKRQIYKVPLIGWSMLKFCTNYHPVLLGLQDGDHVYFLNSYAIRVHDTDQQLAITDYGGSICAIVGRNNMIGTQFHPEKSQAIGLRLIYNFIKWSP
ncbi:imidazole glycerol phosphate synthase, glutamine amidotransferase subunit [Candidatus Endolissoclinum faulkneri L2]|uniref:Imidazole glycerol phosphate synthase subunit HisH n=1 Tax=Candidatus Endolissoclinum faulkneri L2 TaxID=1193729 RepID=K7YL81_9PROT|nr:imidazole glycerol phosphate synthase subunit HisH [Candidatus Endolissoclinum faulkneri]AFX98242.1 imidazole glycerol phosphate synthase, glutamine amidotransferase subunit [Candidatus Endolissoclinum faulkneri L2]